MLKLFDIFLIFAKIGAILIGGGYVILPILCSEFVDKRKLIKYDDLVSFFAISQSLPGIVAANISMLIGYKLRGKFGAVTAMFGIIFVPFWTIVCLGFVLSKIINNTYVQGVFWGVGIAVIALITLTIREMWQNSNKNIFFYLIFIAALIALTVFKLSPVQVILIFVILGAIIKNFIGDKL